MKDIDMETDADIDIDVEIWIFRYMDRWRPRCNKLA